MAVVLPVLFVAGAPVCVPVDVESILLPKLCSYHLASSFGVEFSPPGELFVVRIPRVRELLVLGDFALSCQCCRSGVCCEFTRKSKMLLLEGQNCLERTPATSKGFWFERVGI